MEWLRIIFLTVSSPILDFLCWCRCGVVRCDMVRCGVVRCDGEMWGGEV